MYVCTGLEYTWISWWHNESKELESPRRTQDQVGQCVEKRQSWMTLVLGVSPPQPAGLSQWPEQDNLPVHAPLCHSPRNPVPSLWRTGVTMELALWQSCSKQRQRSIYWFWKRESPHKVIRATQAVGSLSLGEEAFQDRGPSSCGWGDCLPDKVYGLKSDQIVPL